MIIYFSTNSCEMRFEFFICLCVYFFYKYLKIYLSKVLYKLIQEFLVKFLLLISVQRNRNAYFEKFKKVYILKYKITNTD